MSLPSGAFLTTLQGKKCTAIPRAKAASGSNGNKTTAQSSTSASSSSQSPASPSGNPPSASTTSSSIIVIRTTLPTTTSFAIPTPPVAAVAPSDASTPSVVPPPVPETTTSPAPPPVELPATTVAASSAIPSSSIVNESSAVRISIPGMSKIQASSSTSTIASLDAQSSAAVDEDSDGRLLPVATPSDVQASTTLGVSSASSEAVTTTTLLPVGFAGAPSPTTRGSNAGEVASTGAPGVVPNDGDNRPASSPNAAVAGGVVGGLAFVSVIVFLVWFWRKRVLKKRRSTLLTPLHVEPGLGSAEKAPYMISRGSIGPTALPTKLKANVEHNIRRIQDRYRSWVGRSPVPSVNLNRGNSQYLEVIPTHSRQNSAVGSIRGDPTMKERIIDWWNSLSGKLRLREALSRLPHGEKHGGSRERQEIQDANKPRNPQPDFLTLINMDDKQLDAQVRGKRKSKRRVTSAGSADHFLAALNFNPDPFLDANSMDRNSVKPAPLKIMNPGPDDSGNPFADENAVQQPGGFRGNDPASYAESVRRSRGQSVGRSTRPPSSRMQSLYRESGASATSFAGKRNKFRSDPFDLDRPELLSGSNDAGANAAVGLGAISAQQDVSNAPKTPRMAHTKSRSVSSSKYSSGVSASLDEWSDPGPDVGSASSKHVSLPKTDMARPNGAARKSVERQGSVGKAY